MRTRVAFQLRSSPTFVDFWTLISARTMRKHNCACDRGVTVLGAPRADQHRFRRNFEGLGPMGDAMNKACAAWVRARGIPARALLCVSTLTKKQFSAFSPDFGILLWTDRTVSIRPLTARHGSPHYIRRLINQNWGDGNEGGSPWRVESTPKAVTQASLRITYLVVSGLEPMVASEWSGRRSVCLS